MCQIFGYSGLGNVKLNSLLQEFYSHSDLHPNGWGLALLDGIHANIEKETLQATKSHYLRERYTEKIASPVCLAHIRYATIGNVDLKNCHPFTAFDAYERRWTLIHNGTIFDFAPMDKYVRLQRGDTDSERILLYIIDKINERSEGLGRELSAKERCEVLEGVVSELSPGNKLNLLIYDGELLYAHTNLDGSLHYYQGNSGVLFSTEPLVKGYFYDRQEQSGWMGMQDTDWENVPIKRQIAADEWKRVPPTRLFAYDRGTLVYTGAEHGSYYVEDKKAVEELYLAFANL